MRTILIIVSLMFFNSTINVQSQTKSLSENQKIELLITSIETLKDAKFERNGTTYSASKAASHLRMKREKAGDSITSAQDFINKIASHSSMSGQPYKIIHPNGKTELCRDFLNKKLSEINNK